MSTHTVPEAMQSSTKRPPTRVDGVGDGFQVIVREHEAGGRLDMWCEDDARAARVSIVATTSSIGAGANGRLRAITNTAAAVSTISRSGMSPASKIWLQR